MIFILGLQIVKGRSPPDLLGILALRLLGKINDPSRSLQLVTSNHLSDMPESVSSSKPEVDIPGLLFN